MTPTAPPPQPSTARLDRTDPDGRSLPSTGCAEVVVEIPLLLPGDELARLADAAAVEGLSVARLLRRVIREYTTRRGGQPGHDGNLPPTEPVGGR